jgi:hypothetical protein
MAAQGEHPPTGDDIGKNDREKRPRKKKSPKKIQKVARYWDVATPAQTLGPPPGGPVMIHYIIGDDIMYHYQCNVVTSHYCGKVMI